jgi:GxxExxY protein
VALEHEDLTGKIIGAAIEVHRALGPGFIESIYENALVVELDCRQMKFQRQLTVPVKYRDVEVGLHKLDLLVEGLIVVELKAVKQITNVHFAVVRSYLHALDKNHGLILNFSKRTLETKRVIVDDS